MMCICVAYSAYFTSLTYFFLQLLSLSLPEHWMKQFFLGHAYLELQLKEDALKIYQSLSDHGFTKCTYVMAQIAETYNHLRGSLAAPVLNVEIFS